MIKHIVMWKFKENAGGKTKAENIAKAREMMAELRTEVESVIDLEIGTNVEGLTGTHDLVLYSEFQDAEGLEYYQTHPKHVPIVEFMKEVVENRACVDYDETGIA